MGIRLGQEMGVIGCFRADVSAHVIDHRGVEAVYSALMCLLEMNLKYRNSFLDIFKVYCH